MNNGYIWVWWVFTISITVLVAAFWRFLSYNVKWISLIFLAILIATGMVFFINWKKIEHKLERGGTWYYTADVAGNNLTTHVEIDNGLTGDYIGTITISGLVPMVEYNGVKISTIDSIVGSVQKFVIVIVNDSNIPVSLSVKVDNTIIDGPSVVNPLF